MKERNPVFDIVKALMMLWVIWGHLGLYNVVSSETSVYMLNAKIGVNMPVFFMVGGFLAASTFEMADWAKLLSRAVHFVWPQIAIGGFYALLVAIVGGHYGGTFSWVMNMWFLRTYAIIYLVSTLIFHITADDRKRYGMFLCVILAMLLCPSRCRISWCDQVIHMLPYFVFGLICLKKNVLYCDWRISCACGALYFAVVFLQGDSSLNGMNFWKVNACVLNWHDCAVDWHESMTFIARTVVGISGSIFVLFLVNLLIKVVPHITMLSSFGVTTLGVYILHEYPFYLLGRHVPLLPFPAWSRWLVAIGVFLLCHFVVVMLKRCWITRFVFFGDEKMLAGVLRRVNVLRHD